MLSRYDLIWKSFGSTRELEYRRKLKSLPHHHANIYQRLFSGSGSQRSAAKWKLYSRFDKHDLRPRLGIRPKQSSGDTASHKHSQLMNKIVPKEHKSRNDQLII